MVEIYGDTANVGCSDCKHWNSLMNGCSTCKRIDGQTVKFYRPTFLATPSRHTFICRDFEPNEYNKMLNKCWIGFDDYFTNYLQFWDSTLKRKLAANLAFQSFTLNNDEKRIYNMGLQDFIDGNMWRNDGLFNAVQVIYYKRGKVVIESIEEVVL